MKFDPMTCVNCGRLTRSKDLDEQDTWRNMSFESHERLFQHWPWVHADDNVTCPMPWREDHRGPLPRLAKPVIADQLHDQMKQATRLETR